MARRTANRFAVPPYEWCFVSQDGSRGAWNWDGRAWESLSKTFTPSVEEVRRMLRETRKELRWSRPMMAAVHGVPQRTVRSWEMGTRNPCAAACRPIQLLHMLMIKPSEARSALDLVFGGKSEQDMVNMFEKALSRGGMGATVGSEV